MSGDDYRDFFRGAVVLAFLVGLAFAAALMLLLAPARAESVTSLHLRAHLTPEALATWLTAPTSTPQILDAEEIDNHDPANATTREVAVDAIVSAEWSSHGEVEVATDGTPQAVIEARKYVLRAGQ